MAKRKVDQTEIIEEIQEVQAPSQPFWEKYQNYLVYAIGAIAVLAAAWWGYKSLVVAPKQQEAVTAMWQAQRQFESDSFNLALNNPGGGADGFLTIVDKYSGTPAGNLAKYYAGICYLNMGDFDNAQKYMEEFSPEGDLLPTLKKGLLGDIASEKKDFGKALDLYESASNTGNSDLLKAYYCKKLAMLNEFQGNKEAALKAYKRYKTEFPNQNSNEWQQVDKYIYRLGGGQ
ncbi:MAG: tetratricopeptide repeat protein [Saprospiraceae bacterium]|nr:tetratricopeptide repeat protein [Saprospiraceae bacterium]